MNNTKDDLTLVANTIRMLSADAVEKANSGHPGMPMGMAELATVLWLKYLNFNPKQPHWINRDRFVLSNGHGCMLLYSMLHLSGYDVSLEDLKNFRQWDSKTPGHPEFHFTPGVEATTGPLGQGIANGVGMAIAEKVMAARFENGPINHRVFVFAGDGCMQEGVSGEASSMAGHLGLGNLTIIYDDNHISIAGPTSLSFSEDVPKRYESYGWHVQRIDGHDFEAIDKALETASKITDRPTLIAARTTIGKGAPHKANDSEVHGSPLGKEELAATRKALNWPEEMFHVPTNTSKIFAARHLELTEKYASWEDKFKAWQGKNTDAAKELDQRLKLEVPKDLEAQLLKALPEKPAPIATRKLSQTILQAASALVPSLIGGSADLEPSTFTLIAKSTDVEKNQFAGKNLRFGIREHGMGAVMNGMSYYGGFIPYGSTFLTFSDYMRPTLRLAAISHIPGLFIFTHDSVFLGEDGPTHQPIEHLQSLRLINNLWVMRPADGVETAICYAAALRRKDGPCAMIFSRQNCDPIQRPANFDWNDINKGAYIVHESGEGTPEIVFIATGSEVGLAIQSATLLSRPARVVSMPCVEQFHQQSPEYRSKLIPRFVQKVVIEAGSTTGWRDAIDGTTEDTLVIGIDRYGASAPAKVIAEKLGLTPESVVARVREQFFNKTTD
jgi:transketolase